MKNGIILPALSNLWCNIHEKWNTSLVASLIKKFEKFISRSLLDSTIVSALVSYKKEMYLGSLINKFIISIIKAIRKTFYFINRLFIKSIKNSGTFNMSKYILNIVSINLFQLLCIILGTGIITFAVLSLMAGRISIKRAIVFLFASFILWFLGFIRIEVKELLNQSKFATIVRNFFDYYC